MSKVSIIIPVYNVEKYLDQCLESVVHQTLSDIEIILVDDGSPDNCPQLCDAWARKDSRIKVVHQKNKGIGGARNTALDLAQGEYILFVDSDDWIDLQCCEKLYETAVKNDSDLVLMEAWLYDDNTQRLSEDYREFFGQEAGSFTAENYVKYFTAVCMGFYRNRFLNENKLRFLENSFYEDNSWGVLNRCFAENIAYGERLYYYRQHTASITGEKNFRILDWCHDFFYFYNYACRYDVLKERLLWGYQWYILNFYNYLNYLDHLSPANQKLYLGMIQNIFLTMNMGKKDFLKNSILGKKNKEIYKFYQCICAGSYQGVVKKYFLFNKIPIATKCKTYLFSPIVKTR